MPRRTSPVKDPYGQFQYKLELGMVFVAGFSECTGLQMETKVETYQEGGRNETELKFPTTTSYGNIVLKKGVTGSDMLMLWQLDVTYGVFLINTRKFPKSTAILLKDEANRTVKRWQLINAFPVKWVGPDLKGDSGALAIETLELAHEGIFLVPTF